MDKEALRIIRLLPQWKPGTWKGKPVKVKYTVPVLFKLEETDPKEKEDSTVSEPTILVLQPILRDIPSGKCMNPDSLTMTTEFAYYPLSATQVNVLSITIPNKRMSVEMNTVSLSIMKACRNGNLYPQILSPIVFFG